MKSAPSMLALAMAAVCLATPVFGGGSRLGVDIGQGMSNDNVDKGLAVQGYLEYDMQEPWAFRGGISYYAGDVIVDMLSDGDVSMFGIEAAAHYMIKAGKSRPYIGGGVGYYMFNSELSAAAIADYASLGYRVEEDLDSGIGFFFTGGISFPVSEKVSFGGSVKYLSLKVDENAKVTDLSPYQIDTYTAEIEMNTLFISVGMQVDF